MLIVIMVFLFVGVVCGVAILSVVESDESLEEERRKRNEEISERAIEARLRYYKETQKESNK